MDSTPIRQKMISELGPAAEYGRLLAPFLNESINT
jgi:hypothetical protein